MTLDLKKVNGELFNLYFECIKKLKTENKDDLKKLIDKGCTNLLLLKCTERYAKAKIKILFVGQETQSYIAMDNEEKEAIWGSLDKVKELEHITMISEEDYVKKYQDDEYEKYLSKPRNSNFQKFVKNIERELHLEGSSMITNVFKCAQDPKFKEGGKKLRSSKFAPDDEVVKIILKCFGCLLKEEIKILKPDYIIFLSGPKYVDCVRKQLNSTDVASFNNSHCISSEDPIKKENFVNSEFKDIKSYYTYHPRFLKKEKIDEKVKKIIVSLIKKK